MASDAASRVLAWLVERLDEMVDLLERLVRAESPTLDPAAQRGPFALLAAELERAGCLVRACGGDGVGRHLYARPLRRDRREPRQLLIGHMDTVWPVGTLAEMPVRVADGMLYGPGTADMKGGLVEIVFALRALQALDLRPPLVPVVLVNTDEEIGSPDSGRYLRLLARGAERAFVLESGEGADGRLKIARKGLGSFTLTVHGRSSHAGADFESGVSAILELSHQVQALFDLNDPARGITVNVGTVDGGLRPNVVAPTASAVVDVRVPTAAAARAVEEALHGLHPVLEGAEVDVTGGFRRPPMEPLPRNRVLLASARRLGSDLGLRIDDAGLVGGGSDANTASLFTATLDGLGPVGEGSHAADERVDVSTLPHRTALLASLVLEPSNRPHTVRGRRAPRPRRAGAATRVALVGTDAGVTNPELVAAWRELGLDASLVPPRALAALDPRTVALGRLDVVPTLDSVESGLVPLLLLERRGCRVLNPACALAAAHDKLLTARLLARARVPHPRTAYLAPRAAIPAVRPPVVVKPRLGSWGADVFRCETDAELRACLEELETRRWFQRRGALVQELVPPQGRDLRLVVAGGRVVGAVRRKAAAGEWRTNVSLGARRSPAVPDAGARALAIAAAAAVRADLVGVDLLPTADGWTVVELNGAADFDAGYSLPGRDVYRDAAVALRLLDHLD